MLLRTKSPIGRATARASVLLAIRIEFELTVKETAGKRSSPGGTSFRFRSSLELVAQCELHYARVGQQTRVVTERRSK
jgi:hypothetical protein